MTEIQRPAVLLDAMMLQRLSIFNAVKALRVLSPHKLDVEELLNDRDSKTCCSSGCNDAAEAFYLPNASQLEPIAQYNMQILWAKLKFQ